MWKCKHCKEQFEFSDTSDKANHTRWCDANPKRNDWNKAKGTISKYGKIKSYEVTCNCCSEKFFVKERENLHPQKVVYYCSRSCANNRQNWWNENAKNYRILAFRTWEQKCAVCGFDKIVAVHHVDENHYNNDLKNLIPLCPNHHEMVHSKWKHEMKPLIEELVRDKWGISANGNTSALHAEISGSIPLSSTTFET